ncbi:MAG: NUDIX domain-containing protein [Actinomycetales bacterium]|nr:NUDIX domain-containing protein [Actinomycetales bacterium]
MPVPPITSQDRSRGVRRVQRVGAYGLLRSADGAVLLVRASRRSDFAGHWFLPGGGVRHGEDPQETVVREVAEETGIGLEVAGLRGVEADVLDIPHRGVRLHTVRLLYDLRPHPGSRWLDEAVGVAADVLASALRPETDGTSDAAALVPEAECARLPLMPFVSRALGLPETEPVAVPPARPVARAETSGEDVAAAGDTGLVDGTHAEPPEAAAAAGEPAPVAAPRVQRSAAYALVTDQGRVLLTRLAHAEGVWTLPGGGIRFGEQPVDAAIREVHEEAGLPLTVGELIDVDSRHFTGHAPDGVLEDFHGIRVLYRGEVPAGSVPRVVEIGGTTDAVEWVRLDRLSGLPLTALAAKALRHLPAQA